MSNFIVYDFKWYGIIDIMNPQELHPNPISSHYPHINLLRAFAALSVLVYHVIELGKWHSLSQSYGLWWFHTGWMAVDLFFVISGFVITYSLLQWKERGLAYRDIMSSFIQRRFWRIMPLYVLTGLCFLLLNDPLSWLLEADKRKALLTYFSFTQSYDRNSFGVINGISWTVALEFQFYVVAALTLPLWQRYSGKPLRVWLGIWLMALLVKEYNWLAAEAKDWGVFQRFYHFMRLPAVIEEFALGMALALWRRPLPVMPLLGIAIMLGAILFPIYFTHGSYWDIQGMILFWRTGLALFFMLIVAIAINLPALKKPGIIYGAGFYLGEISYGIYLWHQMVIELVQYYFKLEGVRLLGVVLMIVLPLSALIWHNLEQPFIRYGKKTPLFETALDKHT